MFGKLAADALGLSDIGSVIKPQDYDKVDADDYIRHEDNEKIYFLIKSKSDEYCFTNLALIHVDGANAMSKKRTLKRYSYATNKFSNVTLETAGTVDLDIEIKFAIGEKFFSIDVHKKFIEEIKDLYKSLVAISEISHESHIITQHAMKSLELASQAVSGFHNTNSFTSAEFEKVTQMSFNWLLNTRANYQTKDFGKVFEKYINN